jgi:hypothetical protein
MTRHQTRLALSIMASMVTLAALLAACGGATPASTTEAGPALAMLVEKDVVIYDLSGKALGEGTVNLFAPSSMKLSDIARIQLEISGIITQEGAEAPTKSVAGAETPPSGPETAAPTLTPAASAKLSIHEIMGATLGGVDAAHFTITAIPTNGMRNVNPKLPTRWEWTLRPAGPQAAGTNYLEVLVYYPHKSEDGTEFNEEIATFQVTLEVEGPPTPTPTPTPGPIEQLNKQLSPVAGIAGAITAIAGAIGVLYGAYRFITGRRRRKPRP